MHMLALAFVSLQKKVVGIRNYVEEEMIIGTAQPMQRNTPS
jgi:hypothetical protein